MPKTAVSIDMHNIISSTELEQLLKMQLNTLKNDPTRSHTLPPLMVWGAPGQGKSSIIRQVAEDMGIDFIDFRLSQIEPVDLRGLPVPNKEDKSVEWYVTGEFPRDKNSRGILLFDELSAADRSLQVAAYELILDRRLGKLYSLPDGWLVVGAGNRTEDRAVSTTMSSALANRFMHVELQSSAEDWIAWAIANDIHPAVSGFIRYRPEYLFKQEKQNLERGWPSPRSWHRVSEMCHIYDVKKDDLLRKIVYGLVGNQAGVEFMTFYKLATKFDDVLKYMLNPSLTPNIPSEHDKLHAFCSALSYLVWKGADEKEQKIRVDGFIRILMSVPNDFATMCMTIAMKGKNDTISNEHAAALFNSPMFSKWADKFGKAFEKHLI